MIFSSRSVAFFLLLGSTIPLGTILADSPTPSVVTNAALFPLSSVRLLKSPFTSAVDANREYILALDPDRLLAPFRREAGLEPRKPSYGNWESGGLDGHIAGHYLAALANMIASGDDTKEGELKRRLNYMIDELEICQKAWGNGYIGGVPGSRELWQKVKEGHIEALNAKWVPWYNLHKTFAGLRDAYLVGGNQKARTLLINFGNWCADVTSGLSDDQIQQMLGDEHGGMNEVLADIYVITGDKKFLTLSERFCHKAVLDPLEHQEDKLTGLHANTQIPKVIGLEEIAILTGDTNAATGARFFWDTVTGHRSVAFGGNSVSEHFNDTNNFQGMLEHREGPETCNSYNMLRLTEKLFAAEPQAKYADFYERVLFNHILSAINPQHPGYVYFTPIRPGHYRVYSQPNDGFWCCVGTGMENPGKYGQFIYAKAKDGIYVNLFIASELTLPDLTLKQETAFPDEEKSRLTLKLPYPETFTLYLRHPAWVAPGAFSVKVNGQPVEIPSTPSSYLPIRREWKNGDQVAMTIPMQTTLQQLPDKSDWYAILRGPIVLASPDGTEDLVGLRAGAGRGDHIAAGPLIPLDKMPILLTTPSQLPSYIKPDPKAGPMRFRIMDVSIPASPEGLPLEPFFRLHDSRYQMYFAVTTKEGLMARQQRLAAIEKQKLARDAATLDSVAVGEQQSEVDHAFASEGSGTGIANGHRWRDGHWFQYTLKLHNAKSADLSVTYWGGDEGRNFDIYANGKLLATEHLHAEKPEKYVERRYKLPTEVIASAPNGEVTIKFSAPQHLAGGIFDLRLLKEGAPQGSADEIP